MSWYFNVHGFSHCKRPEKAKDKIFPEKVIFFFFLKEKQGLISILLYLVKEMRMMSAGHRSRFFPKFFYLIDTETFKAAEFPFLPTGLTNTHSPIRILPVSTHLF